MQTPMQTQQPQQPPAPLVILMDIDGTMVGRVGCLICEVELHKSLAAAASVAASAASAAASGTPSASAGRVRGMHPVPAMSAAASKALRDSVVARLRYGIVRPYLDQFCRALTKARQDGKTPVELFVYTASDATWAAFLVPCIEAALGTRFNRPIFTRDHCVRPGSAPAAASSAGGRSGGDCRKSIALLRPAILRALRRRYPGTLRTVADLADRVVLVDNTADVTADPREAARVVACPTYAYNYVYDVLGRVDVDALHRQYAAIAPTLVRAGLFPPTAPAGPGFGRFSAAYYRHLADTLDASAATNVRILQAPGDRFWAALLAAVDRLRDGGQGTHAPPLFTDAAVAAINAAVRDATPMQIPAQMPGPRPAAAAAPAASARHPLMRTRPVTSHPITRPTHPLRPRPSVALARISHAPPRPTSAPGSKHSPDRRHSNQHQSHRTQKATSDSGTAGVVVARDRRRAGRPGPPAVKNVAQG
jgi:hypothetical protein